MKKDIELPELTRVSSKGQVVIPRDIRKKFGIRKGSILAISAKKDILVLKKLNKRLSKEDLKTLRTLEEAWKEIEQGKYKVYKKDEFFKEFSKW